MQLVILSTLLWVVLHTRAPNLGESELLDEGLMNLATEVNDSTLGPWNNDWRVVVGNLAARLGVNTDEVQVLPNLHHKLIEVPLVLCRDWHIVGDSVEQIELLN